MATMHRARAKLQIKKRQTASVQGRAKAVRDGLTANKLGKFGSPNPTPTLIDGQITTLDKAESLARTRAAGAASARNVERTALVGLLETALTYVQQIADASATYDEAVAVIEAAGMLVAIVPQHNKQILEIKQGPQSGSAVLSAFARLLGAGGHTKAFFNWQQTSDGKTFINLPSTPKAKTTVTGLTPLATYGFRVSVTKADGTTGEWTQIFYFIVH